MNITTTLNNRTNTFTFSCPLMKFLRSMSFGFDGCIWRFPHGTSKRMELRSTWNFEAHGTSKRTELRNARNFEAHGTAKRMELRKYL